MQLIGALLACVLALIGCGAAESGAQSAPSAPTASAEPATAQTPGAATAVVPPAATARSAAQQKLDSQLLAAVLQGSALPGVPVDDKGMVLVEIRTLASDDLPAQLQALGAEIISSNVQYRTLRARAPLRAIEHIADLEAVLFIQPAPEGITGTTP